MSSNLLTLERIRRLEEIAFRAWPALEAENHAGWLRRFNNGYTKRSNSINGLDPTAEINSKVIDDLEAPYRARGLLPVWRLTPLTPPATDRLVNPAQRPTMTRMLQSIASPVGFALVEEAGQPLAFALGVAEGGHLGLFDILVSPAACRRGLGYAHGCWYRVPPQPKGPAT